MEATPDAGGVPMADGSESSAAIQLHTPDSGNSRGPGTDSTERVTLQEAATQLGVGITTARRWVKSGRLKAIREETPQGHTWRVLLPTGGLAGPNSRGDRDTGSGVAAETGAIHTDSPAVREVVRLEAHVADLRTTVTDLRQQLARKDEELSARRREVQELHVLLGRAQLPKPVDAVTVPESVADADRTPQGTPRPDTGLQVTESGELAGPRLPWWKRLLFG